MNKYFSIALLSLISCAEEEQEPINNVVEPAEEPVEITPDPEPDVDHCAPNEEAEGVRFEGKIEYPDGTMGDGSNTRIHMCSGNCQTAQWGENGFCYPEGRLAPGVYSFKVIPFGYEDHATPLGFITIGEEDVILEEAVKVPAFENKEDIADGTFYAGNGLEINVVADGFTPHYGGGEYVSAVSVDPSESGLPIDELPKEQIIGMWYLGSFDAVISPEWSLQMIDTDLPVGTTVKILNGSYAERKWVDAGTATVRDDGILYSDENAGLSVLSTLILIEE